MIKKDHGSLITRVWITLGLSVDRVELQTNRAWPFRSSLGQPLASSSFRRQACWSSRSACTLTALHRCTQRHSRSREG